MIYRRNTKNKAFRLQFALLALLIGCTLGLVFDSNWISYLLIVVIGGLSFVVIDDLSITADSVILTKKYLFCLINRQWIFQKSQRIFLTSSDPEFDEDAENPVDDPTDSGLGFFLYFFYSVFPPKVKNRLFEIRQKFNDGNIKLQTRLLLRKDEVILFRQALGQL